MKHWIAYLSLSLLLVNTGCDTVNHSQLQLHPPRDEENRIGIISATERDAVKQALTDIATRLYFEDRTEISLIPDTICSFAQPDVKYPIRMIAWGADNRISIDIFQNPPTTGETMAYRDIRDEIIRTLRQQFGSRLRMIHKMEHITSGHERTPD